MKHLIDNKKSVISHKSLYTRLNSQVGKKVEQELVWKIYKRLEDASWMLHNKLRFHMDKY